MKIAEARQLMQFRAPVLSRRQRVLNHAFNVEEYRRAAKRVLPASIFDYLDGGAEDEVTLRRNRAVFDAWGLMPSWGPVSGPDTGTTLLGSHSELPLTLTPTGATRLFHPEGEMAVAKAAAKAGVPYTLAGLSTVSMEAVAKNNPTLQRWFNFGLGQAPQARDEKLERCRDAGYNTLIVGVDTRALGSRERDLHNGFTAPPALTLSTLAEITLHPGWWVGFLKSAGISFPNLDPVSAEPTAISPSMWQEILGHSDAGSGWNDLQALREAWSGKIILKGCVNPQDVERAADIGLDAVQLSNHGGRQLDHMLSPMDVLQECRQRVGDDLEIHVDSGIRRGSDVVKALALGADACSIGRAYLYGLVAAGSPGVSRIIEIFADELRRTMTLIGVSSIAELKTKGADVIRDVRNATIELGHSEPRPEARHDAFAFAPQPSTPFAGATHDPPSVSPLPSVS
ncbi:alpha-hydroxy acid oxidase [Arthrobacter roseus]|uniref:alpha-hydroxy acid oxidase n=1 Tax=Arthrobacter roseus TaxID=136274 RepID=UPI0019648965|nr:alpha-hydroxy acid oxidase [Arthrobacter roseus]MBM7847227.1 L-lactate dehydrogenase (cytochrome) [Arthrobacter roseus]